MLFVVATAISIPIYVRSKSNNTNSGSTHFGIFLLFFRILKYNIYHIRIFSFFYRALLYFFFLVSAFYVCYVYILEKYICAFVKELARAITVVIMEPI